MHKKYLLLLLSIIVFLFSCSSTPKNQLKEEDTSTSQPWEGGRWNIYGLYDPEQNVRITDFYDNFEPETINYKNRDLYWYRSVDRGSISIDEFIESETVFIGETQGGIEFCSSEDLEGLYDTDKPSKTIIMRVPDTRKFSQGLDKYTVLKIRYRYFYRPVYTPNKNISFPISNRRVSQAKTQGLMDISEFILDEYEIIGKINVPQSQISRGIQRVGDIFSAVIRGTDRFIGRLLGIDDVIPEGEIKLENGLTYQKVGLGEIVKKSRAYSGPDLLLTSKVRLIGDRGNNIWAFKEAEGNLIQTMKYAGHIPSNMKDLRIYYRLRNGGIFEIDEVKQASIFNDQW